MIAAINGYALGVGLELAMCCDVIIAGQSAQLGQPEVRVGIMPGAGGTQRLSRVVGKFHAMRLCLTGRPIAAAEAYQIGLVSEVVPDAEVVDAALEMAGDLARLPPLAVMQIKEAILAGQDASLEAGSRSSARPSSSCSRAPTSARACAPSLRSGRPISRAREARMLSGSAPVEGGGRLRR